MIAAGPIVELLREAFQTGRDVVSFAFWGYIAAAFAVGFGAGWLLRGKG